MRTIFEGLNGSDPLGFMASVGLLRLLEIRKHRARLGFDEGGGFRAWIECDLPSSDLLGIVARDAEAAAGPQPWRLVYEKQEKSGIKAVADLKAPPERFREFLTSAIDEWIGGRPERAEYAAAYGTDVAVDGKGNTKPTAFHFTAAQQQFLGAVETSRRSITEAWVEESLHDRDGKTKDGPNLRWDPDAERSRALMSVEPAEGSTTVNAPLEWLAFRGLPAFPCVPIGSRIVTCGVTGRRQDDLRFHWPLWSCGASYFAVRSLLPLTAGWIEQEERARRTMDRLGESGGHRLSLGRLQLDLERSFKERRARGVFVICTAEIRRTAQGFGNFGPADVRA